MDGLGDEESVLARMRTLSEKFERGDCTVVSSCELERWIEQVANARSKDSLRRQAGTYATLIRW